VCAKDGLEEPGLCGLVASAGQIRNSTCKDGFSKGWAWLVCLGVVTDWVAFVFDGVGGVGAVDNDALRDEMVKCGNEGFG
jgi:hypothetical protein